MWQSFGDGLIECFLASCLGRAEQLFEFCPGLLDRVEIGRIGWQVEQLGAGFFDPFAHRWSLVRAQVIHHHHVAGLQYRAQQMFDVCQENIRVGGLFYGHGCDHAVQAHGAQNGHDLPVAARRRLLDASASHAPRVEPRHRGSDTALIQKNQALRRDRPRDEFFTPLAIGLAIALDRVE